MTWDDDDHDFDLYDDDADDRFARAITEPDNLLTDEEVLVLLDLIFTDNEVESTVIDPTWYPNRRSLQIYTNLFPDHEEPDYPLWALARELHRLTGGDWAAARKKLRFAGLDIEVETAPLFGSGGDEVSTVVSTAESDLKVELERRRRLILARETDAMPTSQVGATHTGRAQIFDPRDPDVILGEIEQMEGMGSLHEWAHLLRARVHTERLRRDAGLPANNEMPRHLVLTGEPGTGKTVGARLLTELYASLGIVRHARFVEASRADLVGRFIGDTAPRTRELFQKALGGVLFIDEAYSLNSGGPQDYGHEAIAELIPLMENHRHDIAVFFAGYGPEMNQFIGMNPGIASRISGHLEFKSYSNADLWRVLQRVATIQSYIVDDSAVGAVGEWFDRQRTKEGFGNAREARNLLAVMTSRHAERILGTSCPSVNDLILLTAADVPRI